MMWSDHWLALKRRSQIYDDRGKRGLDLRICFIAAIVSFSLPIAGQVTSALAADDSFVDGLAAFDAGDLSETVRIWTALASAGDANAQVGLAGLYRAGNGVARDPAEAVKLYRLAAEQGDSNGQLNLGRLYLGGIGVERDRAAAYAWLTLAAQQGRRWAEEQRLEIEPTLSETERDAAEILIEEVERR